MKIQRLTLGRFFANAYIVQCLATRECMLVDAPAEAEAIKRALDDLHLKYIVITHGHHDHIGALPDLVADFQVPLTIHRDDASMLPVPAAVNLEDGQILQIGKLQIKMLHTPGHTPGSVCLLVGDHLIAGDTLFPGGPGRTYDPYGLKQVIASITTKIFTLSDDTAVHPGHGESTTVGEAKKEYAVFTSRPHRDDLYGNVHWLTS